MKSGKLALRRVVASFNAFEYPLAPAAVAQFQAKKRYKRYESGPPTDEVGICPDAADGGAAKIRNGELASKK